MMNQVLTENNDVYFIYRFNDGTNYSFFSGPLTANVFIYF
jgi:hypothetical protein